MKKRIPRLEKDIDLKKIFLGEEEGQEEEDFPSLLESYLAELAKTPQGQEIETGRPPDGQEARARHPVKRPSVPEAELDLHGTARGEALKGLDLFIENARARGLCFVLIITGKGIHSERGPVLKDAVENRLIMLKKKGHILTFRWEKKKKRKSGSLEVYLKPSLA